MSNFLLMLYLFQPCQFNSALLQTLLFVIHSTWKFFCKLLLNRNITKHLNLLSFQSKIFVINYSVHLLLILKFFSMWQLVDDKKAPIKLFQEFEIIYNKSFYSKKLWTSSFGKWNIYFNVKRHLQTWDSSAFRRIPPFLFLSKSLPLLPKKFC